MKKKLLALLAIGICISSSKLQAQHHKCNSMDLHQKRILENPSIVHERENYELATQEWISTHPDALKTRSIITIPVVVHVVYRNATQNISSAQIQSQISALNEDYRLLNPDSLSDTHQYWPFTADAQIEFCLATVDPNGNATTGITRTSTTVNGFDGNDEAEKFTSSGGCDNWDPTRYLNIWVCDLSAGDGLLGYATFPSDLSNFPDYDGVVINYTAFGYTGTATAPNDYGRTATHEIGHWLNLFHIWGDDGTACTGSDQCADTPNQADENYGCPSGTNASCSNTGDMFMNYMDYVDDACMVMFTADQVSRMSATLNGARSGIKTSTVCQNAGLDEKFNESSFEIYPNPSQDKFTISSNFGNKTAIDISIYNLLGEEIQHHKNVTQFPFEVSLSDLPNGSYLLQLSNGTNIATKKVFISK